MLICTTQIYRKFMKIHIHGIINIALIIPFLYMVPVFALAVESGQAPGQILIDPGHSPLKPGAISCTGEKEYVYNNSLAAAIQQALKNRKIPYALTRQPAEEISLQGRARKAAGKKLLISVHHDSVQPQYVKYVDGKPNTDKAKGFSIFVSRKNRYFNQSLQYARNLGNRLRALGYAPSTHHGEPIKGENRQLLDAHAGVYAYDDLVVLKHADSPALLFEAGVLPNPEDERLVKSARYKRNIAGAVADIAR